MIKKMMMAMWCAGALLAFPGVASAKEAWPSRPVHMVIPYPPGGPTDATGRLLADKLGQELQTAVVVLNKGGASGNIGAQFVAKAKPDGYTLLFTTGGTHGINPFLYDDPGYDPVQDFEPIVWVTTSPNILVVNPSFPAKDLAEFIALAKANPGKYSSAAPGQGSTPHMFGELFKRTAGISIQHIPYKGSGQALVDVMGGQVPIMFDGIPSSLPLVRAGKLRALAVTGLQRSSAAPDIPTVAETFPGFDASGWFALYAPHGTPAEVVTAVNQAVNKILQMPEVKQAYAKLGADVVGGSPDKLRDQVSKELAKWSDLIEQTGMKAE
ncbi:MAG TPA: tripartite tricarboxylate transporter substrate binding protein [Bordetella sp.]|nr:tripartite tricarboxylate transporter substrate binding protein [Bordetella sp.]